MKNKILFFLTISLVAVSLQAQRVVSTTTLVDSAAYFPQMSDDGRWLLYSNTESTVLTLLNLSTGEKTVVADKGYPGFDARMDASGRVYYVAQQRRSNGLLYRSGRCYDPATGRYTYLCEDGILDVFDLCGGLHDIDVRLKRHML